MVHNPVLDTVGLLTGLVLVLGSGVVAISLIGGDYGSMNTLLIPVTRPAKLSLIEVFRDG